jgi:hypothetical protein
MPGIGVPNEKARVDFLMRVTTVSVKTVAITEAMKKAAR